MIVTYFRSSLLGGIKFCEQKAFIEYNLGYQDSANQKAEAGTITHKVLEVLAACKKAVQDGESYIEDDALGHIDFEEKDLYKEYKLPSKFIEAINKHRSYKTKYKWDCKIPSGHKRYGYDFTQHVLKLSYDYYTAHSEFEWKKSNFYDCENWVWIPLECTNKAYDPRFRQIYAPEQKFDFELTEDWAHYEYELYGEKIEGQLRLKGTIDLIAHLGDDQLEVVDWKGLPLETSLPSPNGWTTMKDVQIGDTLFDKDGIPTKVIGKSKIKYKTCYRIDFDDKTHVICDDEHLWHLIDDVKSIKDLKIGDKIPVTKPIITDDIDLPIDPYVLGIWLGDGRNKNGEISNDDKFVFDEIVKRGYKIGNDISGKDSTCPSHTVYGLVTQLKKLNLLHNKHIPNVYLRASINQRLDLLRGLMDSDGNVNSVRKQAVFTSCNQRLSNDTKELLLSLGQRVNQGNITKEGFGVTTQVYPLHFRPQNINPFLLPRKADQILKEWGTGLSNRRLIKNITKIDKQHTQCIMVDSPTNTYLCTENFLPTHNTGQRKCWATGKEKTYAVLQQDPQLMFYFLALDKLLPEKHAVMTIYFIRDGGPFSLYFDDETRDKMYDILKDTFRELIENEKPKLIAPSFKCSWCSFYKNKFAGEKGAKNICTTVKDSIEQQGMKKTIEQYKNPDFTIGSYHDPGSV